MLINKNSNVVKSTKMSAMKFYNIITSMVLPSSKVTIITTTSTTPTNTTFCASNSRSSNSDCRNITTVNSTSKTSTSNTTTTTNNNTTLCKLKSKQTVMQQLYQQKSSLSTSKSTASAAAATSSPLLRLQRNLLFGFILTTLCVQKFYSIVLMAISDASYKFIYVNVGAYGSEGDSGVFTSDKIGQKICNNTLAVPEDTNIDGKKIPFYFISDDAFPLQERIMKPYSPKRGQSLTPEERIFNYRLSRARRCVENSFGILSNKWICLSQPLRQNPARASKIVLACCVLHNLLIRRKSYCPQGFADYYDFNGDLVEGDWRSKTTQLTQLKTSVGRTCDKAKCVRDNLKYFVNSEVGTVPWQNKCLE